MRWCLLLLLTTAACASTYRSDYALERQRVATRAAKRSSYRALKRRNVVSKDLSNEPRYRARRKQTLLAAMKKERPTRDGAIVAVFDVEDHDAVLSHADAQQLSAYFATALLERTTHRVVPPDRMRAALVDAKTQSYRACYDEACQIELGRRLAADHTVEPGLFVREDGCQLGATLYDLATETTLWASSTTTTCRLMDLFVASERLARSLAEKTDAR
ncbi:MAG: hypothetical protein RMA76_00445 [Deltaproteobacteria bacterium]